MATCALSQIFVKNSFSFCSNLSTRCFSSCVSSWACSITISSASFPSLVTCNFIASALDRNCTSCVTLTCSLYSDFVGILATTNCTYARYLSVVCSMALSTYNISIVIWKVGIPCPTSLIVSSSFCAVLPLASMSRGIGYVPLSFIWVSCIYSRTFLM
jgi:hypothetical protein